MQKALDLHSQLTPIPQRSSMVELFGATTSGGGSESSMIDSIMMPILHSAINRAHSRVHSRDGVLQRLAERSKFCYLAVMQLDACVSCLQSASDDRGFHCQTTACRNLVADLTEVRDRLLGCLTETERAIADKDNELQRLRDSVRNLRSRNEEKNLLEENRSAQDCDQIGSEINSFKETIDSAMAVMQNAISVSEARSCELQFCCEMEKEIMTTLFAGFVRDFRFRSGEKSVKSSEIWSSLGDDLSSLRCKLESFAGSMAEAKSKNPLIKIQEKGTEEAMDKGVNKVSMIIKAHETIIQKKSDKLDAIKESNRKRCKETDELLKCVQRLLKRLDSCADKNPNHEKVIFVDQPVASKYNMRSADTEESKLRVAITEEIQIILLRCMMKDFQQHMHLITTKSIEKMNTRDRYSKELNLQAVVTGEIQRIVLRCVMKDFQQHMLDQVKVLIGQGASMDLFRGAVNDAEERNLQRVIAGEVQSTLLRCTMEEFQQFMHDHELTNSIRQVVLMNFFGETIKNELNEKMADHWKHNKELRTVCNSLIASETRLHIESAVRDKVYTLALKDIANTCTVKNDVYRSTILDKLKDTYQSYNIDCSLQDNLSIKEKAASVDTKGSSSFIQKLDSLLCYSEEQNSLLRPSSDCEKEHNAEYIIQDSEHEDLMIEENDRETDFNSACDKFKKALLQLGTSKMILRDLNDGDSEGAPCNPKQAHTVQVGKERKDHGLCLEATNGPNKTNHTTGFGISQGEFSQVITDSENLLHQKLDVNFVRLAMLKNQLLQLVGSASSLRRKESLYKQAFIRRCENLQKAETEVDILGDQVDTLLCLLERIYKTIQYHAPALQQCSGVLNILTLIKKELNRVMALAIYIDL